MHRAKSNQKNLNIFERLVIGYTISFVLWGLLWPTSIVDDVCSSASFGIMPEKDRVLEKWLNSYPGLSRVDVKRTETKLVVYFNQLNKNQSLISSILGLDNRKPNLDAQAAIFGYQKPHSKFELCTSRGWQDDPLSEF
jgi:hypothetical protein